MEAFGVMLRSPFYIYIPLPCHYYTFTLLFPKPNNVQLLSMSFDVVDVDVRAITFHMLSSFKVKCSLPKSSCSSSNFQTSSSTLRLLVAQSCYFFVPGPRNSSDSCHCRDDFRWHFVGEMMTIRFEIAIRRCCHLIAFVDDRSSCDLSKLSRLNTRALLFLCNPLGDISDRVLAKFQNGHRRTHNLFPSLVSTTRCIRLSHQISSFLVCHWSTVKAFHSGRNHSCSLQWYMLV